MTGYISYKDPRVEPTIDGEEAKIDEVLQVMQRIQQRNFDKHRHAYRGTHVKTQGILKGELTIKKGLPAHLAQGLFKTATTHPVALRFANEPSHLQDDRAPGPRGVGIKVFNVDDKGAFLDSAGQESKTQDFTFNNAPLLELRDLTTTLEIQSLREKNFDNPKSLEQALKGRKDSELQFAPSQLPNQHFLSYQMFSQSAFRHGDYVAKFSLIPAKKLQEDLSSSHQINQDSEPAQHSQWLEEYFRSNDADYDFGVQLLVDPSQQSVEDTSAPWDDSKFPFEIVGKLHIPKGQNAFEPRRRTFWEDRMKLNVWYGLDEHRPLGSVNRLRKKVYQASAQYRKATNAVELVNVSSIDQIP